MSQETKPTPEGLVENAFAKAVIVSQNLIGPLDAFNHLRDWADTDYRDYEEASERAVHSLRLLDYPDGKAQPRWSEAIEHLAHADSCLRTVDELTSPTIQQWVQVREYLSGYTPVLKASSAVGGRRGMYAWLAFQATLAARPEEVTAMPVPERLARFGAVADQLIEQMDHAWSQDRATHEWWNFDGGSDPDREPALRTEWEVESDVLLAALPNQFSDQSLPASALDRYLVARHLADCVASLPPDGALARGPVTTERDMISAMLRLAADRPDQADRDAHQDLARKLNELAVDLDRWQWHVGYPSDSGPVVTNLILTTEHIQDIAREQVRARRAPPSEHVPRPFRIAPGRTSRAAAGPSW